ncbi:MAG: hypothetical protein P4L45_09870 [Ignavibacteriaceae bacterium]|nr:hypothetical protein [Ignavibacteriaceae bacterium]
MKDNKIPNSYALRELIKTTRADNKLTANDLVKDINSKRAPSYISLIESGKIANISRDDLIHIFKILFNLNDIEAETKIEEVLKKSDDIDLSQDEIIKHKFISYDEIDKYVDKDKFNSDLQIVSKYFKVYFKQNPKNAFIASNHMAHYFDDDPGFMMSLFLNLPLDLLNKATIDQKQELLNNVLKLFSNLNETLPKEELAQESKE